MIRTGLVSITFRKLTVSGIIEASVKAGIEGIEWGGDIHVPHGSLKTAEEVGRQTREAGLEVAAYGSYFKFDGDELPFSSIVETAKALKAPVIRVWAGKIGSASTTPEYYKNLVTETKKAGELCLEADIKLAFEFHGNTQTDTNESALKLLEDINYPNVFTYWQPPIGMTRENCLKGINMIKDYLQWIHVFHWKPDFNKNPRSRAPRYSGPPNKKRPLSEGFHLWKDYLNRISGIPGDRWALLEFVEDNSIENFYRDVETLKMILNECNEESRSKLRSIRAL